MNIDLNKYETAVGPMFACQLSIKLFIEDLTNNNDKRTYAETIYEWLGQTECSIDELFEVSYDKSVFILEVLEKYSFVITNSNILLDYADAIGSLRYQKDLYKNKEIV